MPHENCSHTCRDCAKPITCTENYYYNGTCEPCVKAAYERLQAWRNGAPDPELDKIYAADEPVNIRAVVYDGKMLNIVPGPATIQ